jgi:hypothetical protein
MNLVMLDSGILDLPVWRLNTCADQGHCFTVLLNLAVYSYRRAY